MLPLAHDVLVSRVQSVFTPARIPARLLRPRYLGSFLNAVRTHLMTVVPHVAKDILSILRGEKIQEEEPSYTWREVYVPSYPDRVAKAIDDLEKQTKDCEIIVNKKPMTASLGDKAFLTKSVRAGFLMLAALKEVQATGVKVLAFPVQEGVVVMGYTTPRSKGEYRIKLATILGDMKVELPDGHQGPIDPNYLHVSEGVLETSWFLPVYAASGVLRLYTASEDNLPRGVEALFYKKYPSKVLRTETNRRIQAGGARLRYNNKSKVFDTVALNPGKFSRDEAWAVLSRITNRQAAFKRFAKDIDDLAKTLVADLMDKALENEEALRHFNEVWHEFKQARERYNTTVREVCYTTPATKQGYKCPPKASLSVRSSASVREKGSYDTARDHFNNSWDRLTLQMSRYHHTTGEHAECEFELVWVPKDLVEMAKNVDRRIEDRAPHRSRYGYYG